jgi:hypothetical protein
LRKKTTEAYVAIFTSWRIAAVFDQMGLSAFSRKEPQMSIVPETVLNGTTTAESEREILHFVLDDSPN